MWNDGSAPNVVLYDNYKIAGDEFNDCLTGEGDDGTLAGLEGQRYQIMNSQQPERVISQQVLDRNTLKVMQPQPDQRSQLLSISDFNTFDNYRELIQNLILINKCMIITAGTGLGKTTRVPLYLIEILTYPGMTKQLDMRNIAATKLQEESGIKKKIEPWQESNPDSLYSSYITEESMILCLQPKNVLVEQAGQSKVILGAVSQKGNRIKTNKYKDAASVEHDIIGFLSADKDKQKPGKYFNFLTAGLLNAKMNNDPYLEAFPIEKGNKKRISCVIIDEAHERSVDIDNSLALLKKVLLKRPDFKIVVMSATIKANIFRDYFYGSKIDYGDNPDFDKYNKDYVDTDVPILHITREVPKDSGLGDSEILKKYGDETKIKEFKVKVYYLKEPTLSLEYTAAMTILKIIKGETEDILNKFTDDTANISVKKPNGKDIIVFTPTKPPIRDMLLYLNQFEIIKDYDIFFYSGKQIAILPPNAYRNIDFHERTIERNTQPPRWRKRHPAWYVLSCTNCVENKIWDDKKYRPHIIFATDVIESSITLPNLAYVIDLGLAKKPGSVASLNMKTLAIQPTNKASANQRKGRVGRRADGYCFRMYTKETFNNFNDQNQPEILQNTPDHLFIKLLGQNINFLNYDYIEPPNNNQVFYSMQRLIKCKIIPEDFDIYTNVENLDEKFRKNIEKYRKILSSNSIEEEERDSSSRDNRKTYLEYDIIALSMILKAAERNDDILIKYMISIVLFYTALETENFSSNFTDNAYTEFQPGLAALDKCELIKLYDELAYKVWDPSNPQNIWRSARTRKNWQNIYQELGKTIFNIIKEKDEIQSFELVKTDSHLETNAITIINEILKEHNQTCHLGYKIVLDNEKQSRASVEKLYFNTRYDESADVKAEGSDKQEYTYFKCEYTDTDTGGQGSKYAFKFLTKI